MNKLYFFEDKKKHNQNILKEESDNHIKQFYDLDEKCAKGSKKKDGDQIR